MGRSSEPLPSSEKGGPRCHHRACASLREPPAWLGSLHSPECPPTPLTEHEIVSRLRLLQRSIVLPRVAQNVPQLHVAGWHIRGGGRCGTRTEQRCLQAAQRAVAAPRGTIPACCIARLPVCAGAQWKGHLGALPAARQSLQAGRPASKGKVGMNGNGWAPNRALLQNSQGCAHALRHYNGERM